MSFTLINRSSDLDFLDKELLGRSYIGVDTEFRRRSKLDIDLALIQVNDGQEIFLIDCVSIEPHPESCRFLTDKGLIKIFHSCREDIDALVSWTKQAPVNMFDTQLANAFLGGSFSISYKKLDKCLELQKEIQKDVERLFKANDKIEKNYASQQDKTGNSKVYGVQYYLKPYPSNESIAINKTTDQKEIPPVPIEFLDKKLKKKEFLLKTVLHYELVLQYESLILAQHKCNYISGFNLLIEVPTIHALHKQYSNAV